MKKLTITIVFVLSQIILFAQTKDACLPEGITFTTQEEIDNFQTNYPDCTEIEGNVTIYGNNITNLNGLSVLTSIGGSLGIGSILNTNPLLENLTGLEGLISVGGDVSIMNNNALISLAGLDNLTSIGSDLKIGGWLPMGDIGNPLLTSLEALKNVTSVSGHLYISNNYSLTSLTGLENVTSIGGDLNVAENDALTSITELENVASIEGSITVYDNDALTSLTGLDNLTSIGGYLRVLYNGALISLTGLDNVTSIGYFLNILNNDALTSLTGLDNLTSIGGQLGISWNDALTSLTGLGSIEAGSISNLDIHENDVLSTCEVQSICDYLVAPYSTIVIHDNAPGCNNPEEVQQACDSITGVEVTYKTSSFEIYPSPVYDFATLQFQSNEACNGVIEIFNATGVRIQSRQIKMDKPGQQHLVLDFTEMPAGIYVCRVQVGAEMFVKKFIRN